MTKGRVSITEHRDVMIGHKAIVSGSPEMILQGRNMRVPLHIFLKKFD